MLVALGGVDSLALCGNRQETIPISPQSEMI